MIKIYITPTDALTFDLTQLYVLGLIFQMTSDRPTSYFYFLLFCYFVSSASRYYNDTRLLVRWFVGSFLALVVISRLVHVS